jgi:hypothetical protein
MKNLFKLLTYLVIAVLILTSSCTKNFDEINTNPKGITLASLDPTSYGFVFRQAIYFNYLQPYGGSMQIIHSLYFDIYCNYFATTAENFLSDRYVMVGRWLDGDWETFYGGDAPQMKFAEDFARVKGITELGVIKIWKVFSYQRYTDALGPIAYSQFGNMQKTVPFDSQESIYSQFFLDLDTAINLLKAHAGETSPVIASYDPLYGGKYDLWQKFGSSLRLKLGMRLRYVAPAIAKAQCEKAITEGVQTSNDENGWITTTPDNQNPYNIISDWGEYRMSADMESVLKGYLDPRVQKYFGPAAIPDPTDDPPGITYPYEGMRNGHTKSDRQVAGFNAKCSDMAAPYKVVGGAGPKWQVMRCSESYFLRAEGALEGWAMGGTAEEFYNTGIEKSLEENGYADHLNLASEDYVTSTRVPVSFGSDPATPAVIEQPVNTTPIAWKTAGSKEEQLEQIITQKWIGLYPDSQEAYAERRRTHFPILYNRLESENLDVPATSLPVRLVYGESMYTNNKDETLKAIETLNGESTTPHGDLPTTKLWWDKKP